MAIISSTIKDSGGWQAVSFLTPGFVDLDRDETDDTDEGTLNATGRNVGTD